MCLDLNRAFLYSDAKGLHLDAPRPVRAVLHLLDGVVGGEGGGPLAPRPHPLGAVIASTDPVAADLVAVRLMGFDEEQLPILREAMHEMECPVTGVREAGDVEVAEIRADANDPPVLRRLHQVECESPFAAHPGWQGRIERRRP
jgi:uncharacterized protein (DUF362 family)